MPHENREKVRRHRVRCGLEGWLIVDYSISPSMYQSRNDRVQTSY
jgi:hypothetical protein